MHTSLRCILFITSFLIYYFSLGHVIIGEFLQLFPTLNYYVAAELLSLCPLRQLAHLPPIASFLQELTVWEARGRDRGRGGGREEGQQRERSEGGGGAVATTLRRCEGVLTDFYTLLNRNFYYHQSHSYQQQSW